MEAKTDNIILVSRKEARTIEERINLIGNSVILRLSGSRIYAIDRDHPNFGSLLEAALLFASSFGNEEEVKKIKKETEALNNKKNNNMDASEARNITRESLPPLNEVFNQIEAAARQGGRRVIFTDMADRVLDKLRNLGYDISRHTDHLGVKSIIVEW